VSNLERKMKAIEAFFLRAKHWQIFALFMGLFIVGDIVDLTTIAQSDWPAWRMGTASIVVYCAVMGLFAACFLAWFWAMGSFLNAISREQQRLNPTFFKFAIIYPLLYIALAAPFFLGPILSMIAIIIPFHFFAVFCIFYDLYFVAKHLVIAETGKSVTFYDYAGPFFLIWFFPIGIWFVQPRVNRLYEERNSVRTIVEDVANS
jgi:hypothetical protein